MRETPCLSSRKRNFINEKSKRDYNHGDIGLIVEMYPVKKKSITHQKGLSFKLSNSPSQNKRKIHDPLSLVPPNKAAKQTSLLTNSFPPLFYCFAISSPFSFSKQWPSSLFFSFKLLQPSSSSSFVSFSFFSPKKKLPT